MHHEENSRVQQTCPQAVEQISDIGFEASSIPRTQDGCVTTFSLELETPILQQSLQKCMDSQQPSKADVPARIEGQVELGGSDEHKGCPHGWTKGLVHRRTHAQECQHHIETLPYLCYGWSFKNKKRRTASGFSLRSQLPLENE